MKKLIRMTALVLALVLTLTLTAFAVDDEAKAEIVIKDENAEVVFADNDGEKLTVTYTNKSTIKDGGYYMVLVVKGDEDGYSIGKETILYIDQVTGDDTGSISFDVYPSSIEDSVILISGVGLSGEQGPLIAAIIDAKFLLGDVNGDKYIDAFDAVMILQSVARMRTLTEEESVAANVNEDSDVGVADALLILQLIVGMIDSF